MRKPLKEIPIHNYIYRTGRATKTLEQRPKSRPLEQRPKSRPLEQRPKSRPLEQRLKNSPLVQRQKAGSIEKENIKTPSPHLKYSQSKHASFGLSTQQKTIKKHTIRSGGSNGESVSKGKNIEFKSSKSRDKAEKVLSPSLTTPTTTPTETKRYALHKSHGKGRESKSTFSPPISTDIHTIQSHIEESKLNEQLLNALIEFKSHCKEADIEQIGTIGINFYFDESKKHLVCLFSSSRASATILEPLEQFLNIKLATILKEVEFYRNEVNQYSLSYTKRIESEWAYEFFEQLICSQLKNSTSTHLDHLVQITNRKIDQIFIKHATRNSSTKNLSQIYEFIDLLSGTYRNSNNYLKKAEREIGSVNKRGLRALVQTKINERTSAILNKYKVKDTKANKRIISKGLYLYDHNPLCAEKNLLYQSSKLAPSYFQLLGNKQKTLEFAFNLDENHELRSIEKCKSCKAIETILNYQTAQVCIEQRVTWSSPIKTSENITGVFSGFKDKQGREQQHSERCSHDEQTTSSRLLGQETPSITNEGAAEESIDPTLTKRRLFSDPGEFLDGNLAEANKPTYADIVKLKYKV